MKMSNGSSHRTREQRESRPEWKSGRLEVPTGQTKLTRKAGSLCGQLVTDPQPLTERQAEWIETLLERAGLPALEGAAQ